MSRRKGREMALQMLFQFDVSEETAAESRKLFWMCNKAPGEAKKFANSLFKDVVKNKSELDDLISRHSRNWKIERMAVVDRNTIRMAIAEYLYLKSPRAVITDEAVQIAKTYGSEKSGAFVNGILDAVLEEIERREK